MTISGKIRCIDRAVSYRQFISKTLWNSDRMASVAVNDKAKVVSVSDVPMCHRRTTFLRDSADAHGGAKVFLPLSKVLNFVLPSGTHQAAAYSFIS